MCIRYYRERLFPIFGRKLTSDDGDAIYDYEMECEEAMELNYRNVNGYLLPELEYKSGEHLLEIDQAARKREEIILRELEKSDPLPEKGVDQMAWVRAANKHRAIAEEIILEELIYV